MIVPIQPGRAIPLRPEDLKKAADFLGVSIAHVKAVVAVESNGHGFDSRGRPTILFEPHVFYRNLRGNEQLHAIMLGVAYKYWKPGNYPRSSDGRYAQLEKARGVNNMAAFEAVSMGMGQILGENHRLAGHATAVDMFVAAADSEGNQLMQMAQFIKAKLLIRALKEKDWEAFARGYNGAGFAKNNYHIKLANAYRRALLGS